MDDTTTLERSDRRDPKGRFAPGNNAARKTGATEFERHGAEVLTPDFRAEHENFRNDLIADQGGLSELSTVRLALIERAAQAHTMASLLAADLSRRGVTTERGRTRKSLDQFFKCVDRFERLARRIGLERRPKVARRTLEDFERQCAAEAEAEEAAKAAAAAAPISVPVECRDSDES
jgi:hypothetical protein